MAIRKNLILNTDSYKPSHWLQFPPGVTASTSYLSSRGGRYGSTVFFGLQCILKETLSGPVFSKADIDEAAAFLGAHGEPSNRDGWLAILERKVGMRANLRGFKLLPKSFRLIQGDGVDEVAIDEILSTMKTHGYSASNIAFGMGGALLQKLDRDTQRFAYKFSEVTILGQPIPVFKDPVTDSGKRSLSGQLALVRQDGKLVTVPGPRKDDLLVPVFENGELLRDYTFDQVRKNAERELL